jgi:hypothetical protein
MGKQPAAGVQERVEFGGIVRAQTEPGPDERVVQTEVTEEVQVSHEQGEVVVW